MQFCRFIILFVFQVQIRFLGLGSPGADHRDIAALMPIVQSDGPLVLRNGATDEQLLLRATLAPFEEAACLPSGEANGQVMVLEISRVRTGATATVP
jgi:hypothetical protein